MERTAETEENIEIGDYIPQRRDAKRFYDNIDHNSQGFNVVQTNRLSHDLPMWYTSNQLQCLNYNSFKLHSNEDYIHQDCPHYTYIQPSFPVENNHFPVNFDPRNAANMNSEDKVKKWIQTIPSTIDSNHQVIVHCYPPSTSYSSSNSELSQWDLTDVDEMLEFQARRITRFTTRLYLNESRQFTENSTDTFNHFYDEDGNLIAFNHDDMFVYGSSDPIRSPF
jgi:hypothetical protein